MWGQLPWPPCKPGWIRLGWKTGWRGRICQRSWRGRILSCDRRCTLLFSLRILSFTWVWVHISLGSRLSGARLVGWEAPHYEDGPRRPDAVHSSALRLLGGQKWRCEKEGSGCFAHLHDASGLWKDEQSHWETEGMLLTLPVAHRKLSDCPRRMRCRHFAFCLQPASKDQVVAMLEKARAVMPAKPAAPAKAGGGKASADLGGPASGEFQLLTTPWSLRTGFWSPLDWPDWLVCVQVDFLTPKCVSN